MDISLQIENRELGPTKEKAMPDVKTIAHCFDCLKHFTVEEVPNDRVECPRCMGLNFSILGDFTVYEPNELVAQAYSPSKDAWLDYASIKSNEDLNEARLIVNNNPENFRVVFALRQQPIDPNYNILVQMA